MKLILGAVIATTLIIIIGVLIISPVFFSQEKPVKVMLSFNIYDQPNLENWCKEVSNFFRTKNIDGTIFISGKIAEAYPECVNSFPTDFDIGSQTYSYVSLTQIQDYAIQLEEVKNGRDAINAIGHLNSKLFKSPYGHTNDNIYSLLSRNEILADFSYPNQYNKFYNGQFLKFDLLNLDSRKLSSESLKDIESSDIPVQIELDSSIPIGEIQGIIQKLESANVDFVNASELTNMELTRRN